MVQKTSRRVVEETWAGKFPTKWKAIQYLVANDRCSNEYTGAGMWLAVLAIMKSEDSERTTEFVDDLLEKAENS